MNRSTRPSSPPTPSLPPSLTSNARLLSPTMSLLSLSPKPQLPYFTSPLALLHRNPSTRNRTSPRTLTLAVGSSMETERGVEFDTGGSFFRSESAVGRDLAVLAAYVHRRSLVGGDLRVLDAMCGCGVRSLRYLAQAGAGFVLANDAFEGNRGVITKNLSSVADRVSVSGERRWVVTHNDANRLLLESYINREYFDLVDVDSFGSNSVFIRSALMVVRIGGLLYLTNTDGFSSGGHRPQHSLASYGAYVRPMPYSNEVGLRILIGGALREATALGFLVSPLFSYYSSHGPIFRVMLRVTRGKLHDSSHYGFICYCNKCGNSQAFSWRKLGQIYCPCSDRAVSRSLVVSGPLWTGPLHDAAFLTEMLNVAGEWSWAHTTEKGVDLKKLLNLLIDESDPQLPFGYIKSDEIASRGKINSPPLGAMISSIQKSLLAFLEQASRLCSMLLACHANEVVLICTLLILLHFILATRKGMQLADHTLPSMQSRQIVRWLPVYKYLRSCSMRTRPTVQFFRLPEVTFVTDEGYAASRSHIAFNAMKTIQIVVAACIQISKELQQHAKSANCAVLSSS